jgi:translation initiation factor 4E
MVVEEVLKSATTEEESNTNTNTNPNPNPRAGGAGEEDEEPEEGEIVGGEEDSKQTGTAVVDQLHPLEHSWTFWFDNPSAKSKQAAWGSSLRPIYTFATVEEFWRLNLFCFCYPIQYLCVLSFCFWLIFVWVLRK